MTYDPTQPQTLTINVFCGEQYCGDWPPEPAAEFFAWLQAKIAKIPPEYAASARIEISSESGYEGSHSGKIEISYERLETDAEVSDRLARAREQRNREVQRLEQQLARMRSQVSD